jgi:sugar phosphate isomerase/epimerase
VAGLQQELGFTCTVHLPFLWVDPASLNEPLRQASTDSLRRAVELVRSVDVHTYVLHLWGLMSRQVAVQMRDHAQRQAVLGALLAQAEGSLHQVCDLLDPRDLCVENLEDSLFDLVPPLLERYGVGICLDVGHLAWRGDSELDFLTRYGDRIREVHLHDAVRAFPSGSAQFSDHLALGQGQIHYAAFLQQLEEMDYEGVVILENNSTADLEESLGRLRAFL